MTISSEAREKRWRMILGGGQADGIKYGLLGDDKKIDDALEALYDPQNTKRGAGLGSSSPNVVRWLGDIRKYFRTDVVRVIQKDALDRLNLQQMLMEPELLDAAQPDVNLVATIMSLSRVIPARTKDSARRVVQTVVDQLMKRLETPMRTAVTGALNRSARNNRPRHTEIDWNRTIRLNLRHWQEKYKSIVPERLVGYGRKQRRTMRDIIICIDQSGSMAESVVYSSIFGAVMASLPAVKTSMVVFDTVVVDLTEKLDDPVDVLFGVQLGGGTDINGAVGYCQTLIRDPHNTIFVLISDLIEGGVEQELVKKMAHLVGSGVQTIVLLALSDSGSPSYDADLAGKLASLGAPSFACTPDKFPDLMAAAITRQNIAQWAAQNDLVTTRGQKG
jgi:Mg-chelatase subunit ChlD